MVPTPEARGLRRAIVISAVLLVGYTAVVAWIFVEESRAWPHVGSWKQFGLVVFCPGMVFQAVRLIFAWRTGRVLRALVRLGTIPAGLFLAGLLLSRATGLGRARFEQAYAPLIAEIGANLADPCGRAVRYLGLPEVAAYNRRTGHRPAGNLAYDRTRFVLSFGAGSIDIDGSTIFYDSTVGHWKLFHNDDTGDSGALDQRIEGLAACKVRGD